MPLEEAKSPQESDHSLEKLESRLSAEALDFLSSPWLYASSQELQKVTGGGSPEFFHRNSSSWRHFTGHAYAVWGLAPFWHTFPREDNSRILLLDMQQTEQLMLMLGLLALSPKLKKMISGARIRQLKETFPGLYPDCLKLPGIHPAVLEKLADSLSEEDCATEKPAVLALGRRLLEGMLRHLPQELLRRWELKFSSGNAVLPRTAPLLSPEESNCLLLSLLHHINSESWQLCCC